MKEISRHLLLDLMEKWEAGVLSEGKVHERAEELWDQQNWPDYEESDSRSIAIEVLSHLDILNHQWITPEDIPAIQKFLETPKGLEQDGWMAWQRYWIDLDMSARKERLKNHPSYCT